MKITDSLVSVVDDDESVRESLPDLLRECGFAARAFASAEAFLASECIGQTRCLILDVAMPGMSGPELQRELTRRRHELPIVFITAQCDETVLGLNGLDVQQRLVDRTEMPIIFITGYGDVPMTVQAMKAGAVEFLTKPFGDDVLLSAIRHAIERSRTALGHETELQALRVCYALLTRREREVMALVVSGLLNKQVGFELKISEITVKAHRGKVMLKMQADSFAELVKIAAKLEPTPASESSYSLE